MGDKDIFVLRIFESESIDADGSVTSDPIPLKEYKPDGFFSIQLKTTGAGSVIKTEYLLSNDGVTYSDCGTDIDDDHGPGTEMLPFPDGEPMLAAFMKIKLTETGSSAVVIDLLDLAIQ